MRFVEQAVASGVKHLDKLSQFAADDASPVRFLRYHAAVERRIRELGVRPRDFPETAIKTARVAPQPKCVRSVITALNTRSAPMRYAPHGPRPDQSGG